ncbi:MAG: antibiotic biosynthesis monooxygenase [Deltaproteobacteria bacterium]|nr:antibiotic biosynthesis monooxygenase [Deltaproteobacteria bacterium]
MRLSLVKISPVQEKRQEVLDILISMKGPTQAESGCLSCWILEEYGDDQSIVYVELWRTLGEMHRHMRSNLYARILEAMELSDKEPEVRFYEIVSVCGLDLIEQVRMPEGKKISAEGKGTVQQGG